MRGITLEIDGNKQDVAFRFTLSRKGVLEKTSQKSNMECDDDANVAVTVSRVSGNNAVETTVLANVLEKYSTTLEAGTYALVVSKAAGVSCSKAAIKLELRATLLREPVPTPSPTPKPTPTPRPTATPVPTPTPTPNPEELRIRNRELKDTAGFSFIAYASESEGCVPVFSRTVADFKKSIADTMKNWGFGPMRFVVSNESGLTHYNIVSRGVDDFTFIEFAPGISGVGAPWSALDTILIKDSAVASVSVDGVCMINSNVFDGKLPYATFELPLWSANDKLPLNLEGNYPKAKFTYKTESGKEYLNIKLGIDVSKILKKLLVDAPAVTSVEWMLGHTKSTSTYLNSYPISEWQPLNLSDFISGSIDIDASSLAARGIYHFRYGAIAVRVKTKKSSFQSTYVLNIGELCAAAYSRTDGSAYHNALFNDLTHPEWNNSPSTANKTGCGFIGAK